MAHRKERNATRQNEQTTHLLSFSHILRSVETLAKKPQPHLRERAFRGKESNRKKQGAPSKSGKRLRGTLHESFFHARFTICLSCPALAPSSLSFLRIHQSVSQSVSNPDPAPHSLQLWVHPRLLSSLSSSSLLFPSIASFSSVISLEAKTASAILKIPVSVSDSSSWLLLSLFSFCFPPERLQKENHRRRGACFSSSSSP
mmetsp:Transcript_13133/g.25822  ORF Transcript_13133/g.25822 Transcript_13133/m.25822 type:complete len:201 (-) Transcript_13133:286-888(-)